MTPRERILAAINHEPVDRIPLDYWGVPEITDKLMKHFGVTDEIGFAKALGIDKIMGVGAVLTADRQNMWDVEMRQIALPGGIGYYEEYASNPLAGYETIDEIEASYTWPTTDMFDYSNIKKDCEYIRNAGYTVEGGYTSLTYFYDMLRGTEQMFLDFAGDKELAEYILYKINEFSAAHTRKILEAGDGLIDLTQVTDDLGSQTGLLMSQDMIEHYLGKYYESNVKLAHEYGATVFHHDDGAVAELIPWIVDKGCEVLNPIQWHSPGWDLKEIKQKYGDKLCFHGGIDNQFVLPFGTVDDVILEVETCIDILASDGTGYILAPCHAVQANTSIENILTMYETARKYKF